MAGEPNWRLADKLDLGKTYNWIELECLFKTLKDQRLEWVD